MSKVRLVAVFSFLVAVGAFASPGAMSLIPPDAVSVGVVKVKSLRTSPLATTLFEHTDGVTSNGEADRFLDDAGLSPSKDVDLLVVATSPVTNLGSEAEILVLAEGRFNSERLTRALVSRGAVKKNGYYTLPEEKKGEHKGAVAFPNPSLAILGSESAVKEALAALSNGGTPFSAASLLGQDVSRIDGDATAWAIVDVTRAARFAKGARIPRGNGQAGEALAAAMRNINTIALWATDKGDSLALGAFGLTNDAETLELIEDSLRGALAAMRLAVRDKSPDLVPVLRAFEIDRSKDSIRITGSIPAAALKKLTAQKHAAK